MYIYVRCGNRFVLVNIQHSGTLCVIVHTDCTQGSVDDGYARKLLGRRENHPGVLWHGFSIYVVFCMTKYYNQWCKNHSHLAYKRNKWFYRSSKQKKKNIIKVKDSHGAYEWGTDGWAVQLVLAVCHVLQVAQLSFLAIQNGSQ